MIDHLRQLQSQSARESRIRITREDILSNDLVRVFDTPRDVVENRELSREQKITTLRQWKDDVLLYLVAGDEGIASNPDNADRLNKYQMP